MGDGLKRAFAATKATREQIVMKDAFVTITCMVGLSTNDRTICIDVAKSAGEIAFLHLEMAPKDFAETLCSHIARPAQMVAR